MSSMSGNEGETVVLNRNFGYLFRSLPLVVGLLVGTLLSGCGKNTGEAASIKGTVKFDGEPVAKGSFRLSAEDGTPGPGGLSPIENGHYEIAASKGLKAGKYLVLIYGFQETGRIIQADDKATPRKEEKQYLPRRYNDDSKQQIEIVGGENVKDFDLTK